MEVGVLVVPAGGVVAVDTADAPGGVVAREQRDHHEALHGQGEVLAHHLGQLVGLALEGEGRAFYFFVVLELDLEEAHHLDGHAGGTGDGHRRKAVGGKDLLHGAVGDDVAHGGAAVPRHNDAVGVAQGHHGGGVGGAGETGLWAAGAGWAAGAAGAGAAAGVATAAGAPVKWNVACLAQEPDEVRARIALRGKKGKSHW